MAVDVRIMLFLLLVGMVGLFIIGVLGIINGRMIAVGIILLDAWFAYRFYRFVALTMKR